MSGIGIITNPHSKSNKRNPARAHLLGYILGEKGTLEITRSLEHLSEVAHQFKSRGIEILAISGGDGTISRTLTAFIQAYGDQPLPKIALLRGGTMNVIAATLGIKGSAEQLLAILLEKVSLPGNLPTKSLRTIHVEGNYGFIYADGTSAAILEEFYKKKSGHLGAAWLGLRLCLSAVFRTAMFRRLVAPRLVRFEPFPYASASKAALGTFASTIERLPLNLPMFGLAGKREDHFQAIAVTSPPEKLLWHLPVIMLKNKEGQSLGKLNYCCRKLSVSSDARFTYTLDGELYTSQSERIDIELGPTIDFVAL